MAGDPDARRALAERVYPAVQRLVHRELERSFRRNHRWILPLFSTHDVVHDVLMRVLDSLARFDGDDDAALAKYLAAAVSHRLIDVVRFHEAGRRDGRRVAGDGQHDEPLAERASDHGANTPFSSAVLAERWGLLRRTIAGLAELDRRLVEERLLHERDFPDIAARLGYASASTARKAFDRAQARLVLALRKAGVSAEEA